MKITINGEEKQFSKPMTITDLLKMINMRSEKIAIEINGIITPKSEYVIHRINDEDKIEIINAVGGG